MRAIVGGKATSQPRGADVRAKPASKSSSEVVTRRELSSRSPSFFPRPEAGPQRVLHSGLRGGGRWEGAVGSGGQADLPREVVPPCWQSGDGRNYCGELMPTYTLPSTSAQL